MSKTFVIGIDFGGVLSIHDSKYINQQNLEHRNTLINMDYAIDSLKQLHINNNHLYLISFCGKKRAYDTHKSIGDSGISYLFKNEFYVKDRQYKKNICSYLGCHFMIDDNLDILDDIKKNNPLIVTIWFNGSKHSSHKVAKNWKEVIKIIDTTEYFEIPPYKHDITKYIYQV